MGIAYGRVERFNDDQLVVALPDLPVVTKTLDSFGVRLGPIDRNAALGLALVADLGNVGAAVRTLQEDADIGPELERFKTERARFGVPDVADLDLLVEGIRLQFARSFPGWKVTIGKNYRPSVVKGYPHVFGGGDGNGEAAHGAAQDEISAVGTGAAGAESPIAAADLEAASGGREQACVDGERA